MAAYKSVYEPESGTSAGEDDVDMDDGSGNRNDAEKEVISPRWKGERRRKCSPAWKSQGSI